MKPSEQPYEPSEDSFLLADLIEIFAKPMSLALDMGTGACIQLRPLFKKCEYVVGTDVNPGFIRDLRAELVQSGEAENSLDLIVCERASALRDMSFDCVTFSPPYLPDDLTLADMAVDGGPTGGGRPALFLDGSLRVLKKGGKAFFIVSSLTNFSPIEKVCRPKVALASQLTERNFMFERLRVYECSKPA